MSSGQINDPSGINGQSSSPFATVIEVPVITLAVVQGDAVVIRMASTAGAMTCAKADTAVHNPVEKVGVVLAPAAIGQTARVVIQGPALVKTTNNPTIGLATNQSANISATPGSLTAVTAAAADIAGAVHGRFMSVQNASSQAWLWVGQE